MFRWGKRNDFWNNSSANDSRNNAFASIPNDFDPDKLPFDDKAKIDEFLYPQAMSLQSFQASREI